MTCQASSCEQLHQLQDSIIQLHWHLIEKDRQIRNMRELLWEARYQLVAAQRKLEAAVDLEPDQETPGHKTRPLIPAIRP